MPCRTCYSNFLKEGKLKTKTTKQQSRCNECHSISQLHQAVPVWRKLYLFHFTEVWKHAFLDTYFAGYHTRSTTYQCKMNLKVCEVFNANKYLHKIWMRILHYNTSWLHQVLTRKSYINSILLSLLRTQTYETKKKRNLMSMLPGFGLSYPCATLTSTPNMPTSFLWTRTFKENLQLQTLVKYKALFDSANKTLKIWFNKRHFLRANPIQ